MILVRWNRHSTQKTDRNRQAAVWTAVCLSATGLVRETAYKLLKKTNPFPEFTGRICPALCEKACVLYLTTGDAVTNRENECAIAERAFLEGYVTIEHPQRNGKNVAVIGSGPAGLSAATHLNYMGYEVTVFEKNEAAGGLLRYGIPNFKLNKKIIDRRIRVMEQEGVIFKYGEAVDLTSKHQDVN